MTVYADKTVSIDEVEKRYFLLEEIREMFGKDILCTAPYGDEWITITGLGEVLLSSGEWYNLPVAEKMKEIENRIAAVAGEQTAHDRCINAYHGYLTEPNEWTRRKANAEHFYNAFRRHAAETKVRGRYLKTRRKANGKTNR